MEYNGTHIILVPSRGKTDTAKRHEFLLPDTEKTQREVALTTGLDVTLLQARKFTETSLLVLFYAGNPCAPQYVVAEFDADDTNISHTRDHGDDVVSAVQDFNLREEGDLTATPPVEAARESE